MLACEISVVVSTYNRADRLAAALDALLAQDTTIPYEVIAVDNNSTDSTAAVLARIATESRGRVRSVFEPRQGLSYGRNTGIVLARGRIVAFSDDDVRVARNWIAEMRRAFDDHPDADYIGGRVLPNWIEPPPRWLTAAHWSPLALQDYGDAVLVSSRERAVCLVGANLAFRRRVFDRVGLFTPSLGRIKDGIGSTEDHEMQLRVWRAGMRGLYVPSLVAVADVTPDRMQKAYHRRWHVGHGRHCARMHLRELVPEDLGPMNEPADIVTLFGAPAFVYAELFRTASLWLKAVGKRADSLFYANQLRHVRGYLAAAYEEFASRHPRGVLFELAAFTRAYARKKLHRAQQPSNA
jgi:glycosyltransferase involved in cell wall biosynthesis